MVLIEGELRDHLYNLAAHNVGRPERATWNRGTCLKWAVFDDYDVEQVLSRRRHAVFGPLERCSMFPDFDMVACPQFQRALFEDRQPASRDLLLERLNGMITEQSKRFMGRVNSGVMLIRKPLLSPSFREELLKSMRDSA